MIQTKTSQRHALLACVLPACCRELHGPETGSWGNGADGITQALGDSDKAVKVIGSRVGGVACIDVRRLFGACVSGYEGRFRIDWCGRDLQGHSGE